MQVSTKKKIREMDIDELKAFMSEIESKKTLNVPDWIDYHDAEKELEKLIKLSEL